MYPYSPQSQPTRLYNQSRAMLAGIVHCCMSFCLRTSIHGFHHIAAPKRHWIERLLWASVTAMAVWGVVNISLDQWQRYRDNPTVVTLEKDFRTWHYNMPGVTACEQNKVNEEKLIKAIKSRWNVEPGDDKYKYYSKFVNVVANSDLFHLNGYVEFRDDTSLNINLYELVVDVMPEHRVKMGSSEKVPTKWIPVITEVGACYTFNSLAVADIAIVKPTSNDTKSIPTTCKYSSQGCYYMFESTIRIDYYIHSPYDVADTLTTPTTTFPSLNKVSELSTTETRAGPGVRELQPRTRHCLYTDEPTEPSKQVYSTNICRQTCRSQLALKLCGCKPFHYFYEDGPLCTTDGMLCLSTYGHHLATFGGIKCSCSQPCVDSIFREVSTMEQIWDRGPLEKQGAVRITVQAPRTRYTRYIVFHFQDLVVSFGGAAGLFLGASFISFVEIGYFAVERLLRVGRKTNTATKTIVKPSLPPYELRIQELTYILEGRALEQRVKY